ncbi:MAG: MarR family transcriptional regulator [Thermoplasmatales archaeon]|jgi:DNA-binding MarR family transcriptional regulator|nr:MarR family transcriptional regulator [Candidatus Thermoplasmatota archaeon]MCL6002076.1 MarR family transcriptional regulator [Candidatus Thermoplasmatota archaeon]MDA8055156.1 MarR family transcriptional regulator [Thermoplasmatales archaeon]
MRKRVEARPLSKTLMSAIVSSVVAVAAVILLILLSFVLFLLLDSSLFSNLPVRPYSYYIIGAISASAVLLVVSLVFLFRNMESISYEAADRKVVQNEIIRTELAQSEDVVMKYLDEGEKEIYSLLLDAGGTLLQRDITSVKGYSKATITRILNRLESKGAIERMRHGTTNQIVLKRVSKKISPK